MVQVQTGWTIACGEVSVFPQLLVCCLISQHIRSSRDTVWIRPGHHTGNTTLLLSLSSSSNTTTITATRIIHKYVEYRHRRQVLWKMSGHSYNWTYSIPGYNHHRWSTTPLCTHCYHLCIPHLLWSHQIPIMIASSVRMFHCGGGNNNNNNNNKFYGVIMSAP